MRSTNTIVQHALEGAKVGGNVRHVTGTGKPKRKAANARRAVVLNVRPPSNPARNKGGRIVTAVAAALMALCANAHSERTDGADGGRLISPDHIDNRSQCGRIKRQLRDGECGATAVASYADFLLWRQRGRPFDTDPSRISEHMKAKGTATDKGASLVSCLKSLTAMGIVGNSNSTIRSVWTYDKSKLRETIKAAIHRHGAIPCLLHTTDEWLGHYTAGGLPGIRLGFLAGNGNRTPPHTVLLCGYDDWGVIFQNCWGVDWGCDGFGVLRWDALERDFIFAAVITGCN